MAFSVTIPAERAPAWLWRKSVSRTLAALITATVHVAVFAVAIYGWQHSQGAAVSRDALVVMALPPQRDEPQQQPVRGTVAPKVAPSASAIEAHPLPIALATPMPQVLAERVPTPSAPEGGSDLERAMTTQAYRQAVMARLEQVRDYPRALLQARRDGDGTLVFRLDREGRLLEAAVQRSTGDAGLDRAALAMVRRAVPYPAIPAQLPDELELTLPVEFAIVVGDTARVVAR